MKPQVEPGDAHHVGGIVASMRLGSLFLTCQRESSPASRSSPPTDEEQAGRFGGQISVFVRDPDRNVMELRGREEGPVEGVTRYGPTLRRYSPAMRCQVISRCSSISPVRRGGGIRTMCSPSNRTPRT